MVRTIPAASMSEAIRNHPRHRRQENHDAVCHVRSCFPPRLYELASSSILRPATDPCIKIYRYLYGHCGNLSPISVSRRRTVRVVKPAWAQARPATDPLHCAALCLPEMRAMDVTSIPSINRAIGSDSSNSSGAACPSSPTGRATVSPTASQRPGGAPISSATSSVPTCPASRTTGPAVSPAEACASAARCRIASAACLNGEQCTRAQALCITRRADALVFVASSAGQPQILLARGTSERDRTPFCGVVKGRQDWYGGRSASARSSASPNLRSAPSNRRKLLREYVQNTILGCGIKDTGR